MFATVPLRQALGIRVPAFEWVVLVLVAAALSVSVAAAAKGARPEYRRAAIFGAAVVGFSVLAPLAGPLSPLYVAIVATVAYGGLVALCATLAYLNHKQEIFS